MIKKTLGVVLAALLAGCATVEMSNVGAMDGGKRMLVIQNDGYMLLGTVPIVSGRLEWDKVRNKPDRYPTLFANNADTQHLYAMAQKIAERENCDLEDVTYFDNSSMLDFSSMYGLVTYDDVAISAVLVPRK